MANWTRGELSWIASGVLAFAVGLTILFLHPFGDGGPSMTVGTVLTVVAGPYSLVNGLVQRSRRRGRGLSPWG